MSSKSRIKACKTGLPIYERIPEYCYRYKLGVIRGNTIIVIGLNPSHATNKSLDRTAKAVEREILDVHTNIYGGYIMLNLYPLVATSPDELPKDISSKTIFQEENDKNLEIIHCCIEELLRKQGNNLDIWAAWGCGISKRKYLWDNLNEIYSYSDKCNWLCKNGSKHPLHPSRQGKNAPLEVFDIENYLYQKHL